MDVDPAPVETQTKSGEADAVKAKPAAAPAPAVARRKRIIDEDEDDDYTPGSAAAAPKSSAKAAASSGAKSQTSAAGKVVVKTDPDAPKATTSVPTLKKSAAVKEEHEDSDSKKKESSAPKPAMKKSAATSADSSKNGKNRKKADSNKMDVDESSSSEDDASDSEDYKAPASKKQKSANGKAVGVKSESSSDKKPSVKKSASIKEEEEEKPAVKKSAAKDSKTDGDSKKKDAKKGDKKGDKKDDKAKKDTKSKKTAAKKGKKEEESESSDDEPVKPSQASMNSDKYKWWEEEANKAMKKHPTWKWATLEHNGVLFPPPYEPHGVKMLYDGKPISLPPEAEEVATWFAKLVDGPHYEKPQFRKNFFADFLDVLKKSKAPHPIVQFSLCDFSPITKWLKEQAELKKARTKEEKDAEKKAKADLKAKYGTALVNGHKEPLGNFTIEPPGLFLGRGDHPRAGMIKRRIKPEDITLNLGRDAPVPPCPVEGHKWGDIVHNHDVGWIAAWNEEVLGHNKYVMFAAGSSIRGASDRKKYEKARRLKGCISKIRKDYNAGLKDSDVAVRQRATAMWIIDVLALRVGNEKKEDEADTVGCCSLRVEHVKLVPPHSLEFDFLGKDSMRYYKKHDVPQQIYDNIMMFQEGKRQSEDIFDKLTTSSLNKHLQSLMEGLTAKVFRTYNASVTLQEQLSKFAEEFGAEPGEADVTEAQLRLFYNRANRQVAILCNHQKSISKTHAQQLEKIDNQVKELQDNLKELQKHLKDLKAGKTPNPKKRAREDDEEGEKKELVLPANPEATKKKIDAVEAKIEKLEAEKTDKGEGAQIQNSTSKINYMDPRITVAFCNKAGLALNKVFPAALLDKFAWAIAEVEEDPDYQF